MDRFDKERCLCGIHVHTGTKALAIFDVVLGALGILGSLAMLAESQHGEGASTNFGTHVFRLILSGCLL
jgi:hypothetical protein